ncbi:hypothetical protein ACHAWF_013608 [Thalassiosira exigua]
MKKRVSGTKQGRRKKSTITSKVFKKAFSFKQNQQETSGHGSVSEPSSEAYAPKKRSDAGTSSSAYATPQERYDTVGCSVQAAPIVEDESTCSSTFDASGLLIFPTAQRLTASSPPIAILDGIHGGIKQQKGDGFLSLRRSTGSAKSAATFSSSAPPSFPARSPYQSKRAQKNLSATLKNCRKPSAKYSMNSAWERRQPTSTSRRGDEVYPRSKSSVGVAGERLCREIKRTPSSNSLYLPPAVSPAYRFVPIGCEEDGYDSFDSADYDICTKEMSEVPDQPITTSCEKPDKHEGPTGTGDKVDVPSNSESVAPASKKKHKKITTQQQNQPPSPASTDGTSHESSSGLAAKSSPDGNWGRRADVDDDHCASFENEEDWFENVAAEIMNLSSLFASSCGAMPKRFR